MKTAKENQSKLLDAVAVEFRRFMSDLERFMDRIDNSVLAIADDVEYCKEEIDKLGAELELLLAKK